MEARTGIKGQARVCGRHLEEIGFVEARVVEFKFGRQPLAVGDVAEVEVDPHERAFWIGGGQQAEAQPNAAAQLQVAEGAALAAAAGRALALAE